MPKNETAPQREVLSRAARDLTHCLGSRAFSFLNTLNCVPSRPEDGRDLPEFAKASPTPAGITTDAAVYSAKTSVQKTPKAMQ